MLRKIKYIKCKLADECQIALVFLMEVVQLHSDSGKISFWTSPVSQSRSHWSRFYSHALTLLHEKDQKTMYHPLLSLLVVPSGLPPCSQSPSPQWVFIVVITGLTTETGPLPTLPIRVSLFSVLVVLGIKHQNSFMLSKCITDLRPCPLPRSIVRGKLAADGRRELRIHFPTPCFPGLVTGQSRGSGRYHGSQPWDPTHQPLGFHHISRMGKINFSKSSLTPWELGIRLKLYYYFK